MISCKRLNLGYTNPVSDPVVLLGKRIAVGEYNFASENIEHGSNAEVCRRKRRWLRRVCHLYKRWLLL